MSFLGLTRESSLTLPYALSIPYCHPRAPSEGPESGFKSRHPPFKWRMSCAHLKVIRTLWRGGYLKAGA